MCKLQTQTLTSIYIYDSQKYDDGGEDEDEEDVEESAEEAEISGEESEDDWEGGKGKAVPTPTSECSLICL